MTKQPAWTGERLETSVFNETAIEHLHRYALAMELVAGKKVLDIACGEGYGTSLLATKAAHVTGMDADNSTIEKAIAKYKRENIRFVVAKAEKITAADNEFDLVVSFETLEHLEDQETMIKEIKRVLKPGGLLIISTPDKKNYSDKRQHVNPFHIKELYGGEFEALLLSAFGNVQVLQQQMTFSSLITTGAATGLDTYTGDFNTIEKNNTPEPLYQIALASDAELPVLPVSLFNGNSIVEQALKERETMVTGTITYKLGHFLLYPFKLIRNLFKK